MADTRELHPHKGAELTRDEEVRTPAVDIIETADKLILTADMPGVGEKGVDVSVEEDTLTITGRIEGTPPQGARAVHTEFHPTTFRRSFTLSRDLKRDAIEGKIRNGVLSLILPKADEAKVRKIPIKT